MILNPLLGHLCGNVLVLCIVQCAYKEGTPYLIFKNSSYVGK